MQRRIITGAIGVALGASMVGLGMIPATVAMAATAPMVTSVSLTSSVDGSAPAGSNVTFVASASQTGSGHPVYDFWTDSPNGHWSSTGWGTSNSYTLHNVQTGSYEVVAYAHDQGQTTAVSSESTNSNQFVNVNTSLTFTTNVGSTPSTGPVTITATAQNFTNVVYQYWIGTPNGSGGYDWSANGGYTTSSTYTFTPSTAGTYKVAVYAKDLNAPQDAQFADAQDAEFVAGETVVGTPSSIQLKASSQSLTVDGTATDTITATVLDESGNPVPNATVTWTSSNAAIAMVQPSSVTNSIGQTTVTVSAGSATGQAVITATTGSATATETMSTLAALPALLQSWGVGANTSVEPTAQSSSLLNKADSAASWWSSAGSSLTLQSWTSSGSMNTLQPGQSVQVQAIWTAPDSSAAAGISEPVWSVNSPDATISSLGYGQGQSMPSGSPSATITSNVAQFVASSPGIYVIRAEWDGTDSVPLVLIVGARSLPAGPTAASMPPQITGVEALSASAVKADTTDAAAMQLAQQWNSGVLPASWVGTPVQGWIPVAGQVPSSWINAAWSQSVTVLLTDANNPNSTWTAYTLPISASGDFSGILASPYTGTVQIEISPSNYTMSASAVSSADAALNFTSWYTQVQVNQAASTAAHLAATADVNYTAPSFAGAIQEAETLWYNAPDPVSGAIAISNWVATHIAYNYTEYSAMDTNAWNIGATAGQTYAAQTGVCENYAQVLTAMYRALGIPSVVEGGVASNSWVSSWTSAEVSQLFNAGDGHAWVVIDGLTSSPLITDPTWNGGSPQTLASANYLSSAYTTDTTLFSGSHYDQGPETGGLVYP